MFKNRRLQAQDDTALAQAKLLLFDCRFGSDPPVIRPESTLILDPTGFSQRSGTVPTRAVALIVQPAKRRFSPRDPWTSSYRSFNSDFEEA